MLIAFLASAETENFLVRYLWFASEAIFRRKILYLVRIYNNEDYDSLLQHLTHRHQLPAISSNSDEPIYVLLAENHIFSTSRHD